MVVTRYLPRSLVYRKQAYWPRSWACTCEDRWARRDAFGFSWRTPRAPSWGTWTFGFYGRSSTFPSGRCALSCPTASPWSWDRLCPRKPASIFSDDRFRSRRAALPSPICNSKPVKKKKGFKKKIWLDVYLSNY